MLCFHNRYVQWKLQGNAENCKEKRIILFLLLVIIYDPSIILDSWFLT